jgi:DNA-binding MarR family transcriptional regulator
MTMADAELPPRLLFGLLFRLLLQHYTNEVEGALRDAGFGDIRPPHAIVLPFVPPEGLQVTQLAALAGVRKQTMAQSVAELERAGYLERRPDPHDKRGKLVVLTERGEAVRPIAREAGRRVEERWGAVVGPTRIEDLRAGLTELLTQLRQETEPPL